MRKDGGREGRAKVAVALRRLMQLAKEVDGVESADKVHRPRPHIDRSELIEQLCRLEIRSKSTANNSKRTCSGSLIDITVKETRRRWQCVSTSLTSCLTSH